METGSITYTEPLKKQAAASCSALGLCSTHVGCDFRNLFKKTCVRAGLGTEVNLRISKYQNYSFRLNIHWCCCQFGRLSASDRKFSYMMKDHHWGKKKC